MAVDPLALAIYGFLPRFRNYEEAGHYWEARCIREKCALEKSCVTKHYSNGDIKEDKSEEEAPRLDMFDTDGEKYLKFLTKLDSADWKDQDHYKVLGLSKLRYDASAAEIKIAYKQKCLKYHPDKKRDKTEHIKNENFACITKAFEQIGMDEQKRRAYDSVDPKFNESVPSEKSVNKENFFEQLGPIFDMNMRWSTIQPVPALGDHTSERDHVECFYNFWFEWNSWREFSYLDEEDKEKGEDRWERREMEKMNKVERERRRKDESKRIRKLVEMAYSKDPRIAQFKKDDQNAKEAAKAERVRAQKERIAEEERKKKEEEDAKQRIKDEEERKARAERDAEKIRKQEAKKLIGAARRRFKKMAEDGKWWGEESEILHQMEKIERICLLLGVEEIHELCDIIEMLTLNDEVNRVLADAEDVKNRRAPGDAKNDSKPQNDQENRIIWSTDENALLIKATNLFPAGTLERWRVIMEYVNEHRKDTSTKPKQEKEVIKQAKLVQAIGLKAVENVTAAASSAVAAPEASWQPDEQKRLEDALRTVPAADPERWNKIAAAVGTKSRKECVTRFKWVAEMVKKNKGGAK